MMYRVDRADGRVIVKRLKGPDLTGAAHWVTVADVTGAVIKLPDESAIEAVKADDAQIIAAISEG